MKNKATRESIGKAASAIGIVSNILLAIGKIVVGLITGFVSVLADGINNLSDCGSSVVSLLSFKLSSKPADKEHPFGHERIEYIFSMVVAFTILVIAFELIKESIAKIISPTALEYSVVIVVVLVASILVKAGMFIFYRAVAKKIDSDILKVSSIDSLLDCVSTSIVLVSVIIGKLSGLNIDGYAGLIVVVFISIAGINIIKEMVSKLIGQAPSKDFVENLKSRILAFDNVLGLHDLNVYSYGPNKFFASVHVELDASLDSLLAHEIIDNIERDFLNNTNIILTGHHDPIVTNDEEVNKLRDMVNELVREINTEYSMHDFRIVKGPTNTNLIFEVAVPFENKLSEDEIRCILEEKITNIDNKFFPVIMVEKQAHI